MSAYHPNVLYIGNASRRTAFADLVESYDWCVLQPTLVEEALAHFVFFAPDVVVIDGIADADFSLLNLQETYFHLHSIAAEPVLFISDNWDSWDINGLQHKAFLPDDVALDDIVTGIQCVLSEKTGQVPYTTLQPER